MMGYFKNPPKKKVEGIPGFDMAAPATRASAVGDVGLEIEVEGGGLPFTIGSVNGISWVPKEDGSLRGGREYVFSSPAKIEDVPELVAKLYESFTANGTRLILSNRCSTHVHLNVSGWKWDKIVTLYLLWCAFESSLINWCGVNRSKNHFALSCLDQSRNTDALLGFLSTGKLAFGEGAKYTAFNFSRLADLGSLEVRCGNAYTTAKPIIDWTLLLNGFKSYAYEVIKTPDRVPSLLSETGPAGLFNEICDLAKVGDIRDEVFAVNPDFEYQARDGIREVQKLAYHFPWTEWEEAFNAVYVPNPFGKAKKKAAQLFADELPRDRPLFADWVLQRDTEIPAEPARLNNAMEGAIRRLREVEVIAAGRQGHR